MSDPGSGPAVGDDLAGPAKAADLFGDRLPLARRYVEWLAGEGITRGLIGPRERERLWERHVLNCAVIGELITPGATVLDIGSGAGLPGLPLALARPDLQVVLVEPLLRRATFLAEVVADLGLPGVAVLRARAEDLPERLRTAYVTARAVAPLERLAGWCLPLLEPGGVLLALKGERAEPELEAARDGLTALGAIESGVVSAGLGILSPVTSVVRVRVCSQAGSSGDGTARGRGRGDRPPARR